MKLKELKEILDKPHMERHMEDELVIPIAKPSVGPHASVKVKGIFFGFDWDNGHAFISPETDLTPKSDKEWVWDMAYEYLMWVATKPQKKLSYEVREARRILDRAGVDYMKYQRFLHQEMSK